MGVGQGSTSHLHSLKLDSPLRRDGKKEENVSRKAAKGNRKKSLEAERRVVIGGRSYNKTAPFKTIPQPSI